MDNPVSSLFGNQKLLGRNDRMYKYVYSGQQCTIVLCLINGSQDTDS